MHTLSRFIVEFVFRFSTQPMRFKELLNANKVYNDGMNLENNIHGFKLRLGRSYLVFFVLFIMINIPILGALHGVILDFDTHVIIILTALITGSFFISFSMFKEFLIDRAALVIITKAWDKHLSLFPFEKFSRDIASFYGQAIEDEIAIGNLQQYIFDKIAQN